MRKYQYFLALLIFIFLLAISGTSCARKVGCPGDNAAVKVNKRGELPTQKGQSQLFDRKMRKRIKSGN
jgi:hypothetical protein